MVKALDKLRNVKEHISVLDLLSEEQNDKFKYFQKYDLNYRFINHIWWMSTKRLIIYKWS